MQKAAGTVTVLEFAQREWKIEWMTYGQSVSLPGFELGISEIQIRGITVWTDLVGNTVCRFPYTKNTVYKFQTYSIYGMCYSSLIQSLQYNSTNLYTYLIQKVANFSLHLCQSGVTHLSYWKPTRFNFHDHSPVIPQTTRMEFVVSSFVNTFPSHLKATCHSIDFHCLVNSPANRMYGAAFREMCLKLAIHDLITPIVSPLLKHHATNTSKQTSRVFLSHQTPPEQQSFCIHFQFHEQYGR